MQEKMPARYAGGFFLGFVVCDFGVVCDFYHSSSAEQPKFGRKTHFQIWTP